MHAKAIIATSIAAISARLTTRPIRKGSVCRGRSTRCKYGHHTQSWSANQLNRRSTTLTTLPEALLGGCYRRVSHAASGSVEVVCRLYCSSDKGAGERQETTPVGLCQSKFVPGELVRPWPPLAVPRFATGSRHRPQTIERWLACPGNPGRTVWSSSSSTQWAAGSQAPPKERTITYVLGTLAASSSRSCQLITRQRRTAP